MASTGALMILVADDNMVNRRIALCLLERLGHGADVAGSGTAVLESLARRRYDVVLMDVEMPGLDGLEATRRIRSGTGPTPHVVAMTAGTEPAERAACMAAGMDDYLSKPLDIESLATALERARFQTGQARPAVGTTHEVDPAGHATAGNGESRYPVVDPGVTRRLAAELGDRGSTLVAQLVDLFLAETPGMLATLHDGCHAGVTESQVRRAAHSLRSNAASLGALRLSDVCRRLETAVVSGDGSSLSSLADQVAAEYATVCPHLERLATTITPPRV